MALRRGSFRRKPVRGTAPADEAWPTDGAPGHCAPTQESTERGCSSHRRKGIFVGPRSLTSCVALCLACPRCRFVSYASPERSCSWFEACPHASLSAELSGHRSFLVRRADGSSARPAAADATPPSAARRHIAVSNHTGQTRRQSIRTRLRSRVGGSGSAGAGIFGGGGATGGGRGTDLAPTDSTVAARRQRNRHRRAGRAGRPSKMLRLLRWARSATPLRTPPPVRARAWGLRARAVELSCAQPHSSHACSPPLRGPRLPHTTRHHTK